MKKKIFLLCSLFLSFLLTTSSNYPISSPKSIFKSLKKNSVTQHLAFYELYPHTAEGKLALRHAFVLMKQEDAIDLPSLLLPTPDIAELVSLITQPPQEPFTELEDHQLAFFEKLGKNLCNRKLKTFGSFDEQTFLNAPASEIDLARALFVAQMDLTKINEKKIRSYEAMVDLMALQVLSKLSDDASDMDKIAAINELIFFDMHYQFPPHSQYAKEIDTYTFLSSVIEKRQGVCLGVTILYLSIAQRIDLQLRAITPPGHILPQYVNEKGEVHNIEATARGLSFPMEMYLGIETKSIPICNHKEVVGLAFMNQASVCWMKKDFHQAIDLYKKAIGYVPNDPLLKQLLGYNYLFIGKKSAGKKLLQESLTIENPHEVGNDTIVEDYLKGNVSPDGILSVFLPVDENRSSIIEKQKELQKVIKKNPKFRAGFFQLANTYLQLGRDKEALNILLKYEKIDAQQPMLNYYLSAIFFERYDFYNSWTHLLKAEEQLDKENHHPKALKELRKALLVKCPPPTN